MRTQNLDISSELTQALKAVPENLRAVVVAVLDEIELRTERIMESATPKQPPTQQTPRLVTNQYIQLKDEIEQLKSLNETARREAENYKKNLSRLEKDNADLKQKLDDLKAENKELERKYRSLENDYAEQEEQIQQLIQRRG